MEVFMFRKVLVVLGTAALVAATTTAVPASAATKISNGVSCKKAGATTKVGTSTYRCAKNAFVKNAKLTWLSTDCVNTTNTYLKAKANLPKIKIAAEATIAKHDKSILEISLEVEKAKKLIPEYQAKIATINPILTALKADTVNLTNNKSNIDLYTSAVRSYEKAIADREYYIKTESGIKIKLVEKAKAQAQSQNDDAKIDVEGHLEMAKLICTKGF